MARLKSQQRDLEIDNYDIQAVTLAGLCHDLGHGPFSHVFDNEFLPKVLHSSQTSSWSHEEMSGKLFERAFDLVSQELPEHIVENLERRDIQRIKDMINGDIPRQGTLGFDKAWLFDIIANKKTSVDVDKLDYISRDSYYTGVKHDYDNQALLQNIRVIDGEICFRQSMARSFHDLFLTRAKLHQSVYSHPKGKAIEYMVVDALIEANHDLKISDLILDPDDFLTLNDSVLEQIENPRFGSQVQSPSMDKAREIMKRLRHREIYHFVHEEQIPASMNEMLKAVTEDDILAYHSPDGLCDLQRKDVIVQNHKIDFAMKNKNPLDHIWYYRDNVSVENSRSKKFHISPKQLSSFYDHPVVDRRVRVFCRDRNERKVEALRKALCRWADDNLRSHHLRGGERRVGTSSSPLPSQNGGWTDKISPYGEEKGVVGEIVEDHMSNGSDGGGGGGGHARTPMKKGTSAQARRQDGGSLSSMNGTDKYSNNLVVSEGDPHRLTPKTIRKRRLSGRAGSESGSQPSSAAKKTLNEF